jgi:diketogulonate reductase-like aldo/keto reductase
MALPFELRRGNQRAWGGIAPLHPAKARLGLRRFPPRGGWSRLPSEDAEGGMKHYVRLPGGEEVVALGQGTWKMADERGRRAEEIAALRLGVELGMTLVDTAEMYGEGKTEELVGEALAGLREEVFLVSKVYPYNASRAGVAQACDRSLRRLKTDRLDLYLLHWPGSVPIAETVEGFEALKRAGKIRRWGVSNFDRAEMEELFAVPGGSACATNQILYNLSRRGPEYDLMPWLGKRGVPVMAYSPIEQGRLRRSPALDEAARKHSATPYQIALAWVMRRPDVIAIPKASRAEHVRENRKAADIVLDEADLAAIDAAYPPPQRKKPLEMI